MASMAPTLGHGVWQQLIPGVVGQVTVSLSRHSSLTKRCAVACHRRTAATYSGDPSGTKEAPFLKNRAHQARTADGIPLPEGWREIHSPSRGIYFHHEASGITQWDFPRGPPSAEDAKRAYQEKVGEKVAQLHPGSQVQFTGLKFQPQLNGKTGKCEGWDHASHMIRVRLPSGQLKAVKPENLRVVQASASRVKPQRLIEGRKEDTGGAGGSWASRRMVLGLLSGGAIAWWAAWYGYFLYDATTKPLAPADVVVKNPAAEAPVVAVAGPLPLGWRETLDPNTGKSYYWKEENPAGTTTWERPKV